MASAKALTSLCMSAQKARPQPTSVATYILAEQVRLCRAIEAKCVYNILALLPQFFEVLVFPAWCTFLKDPF